jgi:hypothetical protein
LADSEGLPERVYHVVMPQALQLLLTRPRGRRSCIRSKCLNFDLQKYLHHRVTVLRAYIDLAFCLASVFFAEPLSSDLKHFVSGNVTVADAGWL